jgi:hypothetical protein
MTETDLGALFRPDGSILKVNLIRDHCTMQSKCFGSVQMADRKRGSPPGALHGKRINDRLFVVKEARPRDDRFGHPW